MKGIEANEIGYRIYQLLHEQSASFTLDGYNVVYIRRETERPVPDEEGQTHTINNSYRVLTEECTT